MLHFLLPQHVLSERQLCDVELLVNGAFSPLEGFMNKEVYDSVLDRMRLPERSVQRPLYPSCLQELYVRARLCMSAVCA